jgi:hypothetical protein
MYKYVCKDLSVKDLYVGQTTNWVWRKRRHKAAFKDIECRVKLYECMRQNGGWDNWDMVLIEAFPCENDLVASARERFLIETLNAKLNYYRPIITIEEKREYDKNYRNTHVAKVDKEYFKNYYEENKEAFKKRDKENREANRITCECGKDICKYNMSQHILTKGHIKGIIN